MQIIYVGAAHVLSIAKHLEDFLDLSSEELKFYLQQRALTVSGTHSDLAARALVANRSKRNCRRPRQNFAK